jgi:N-acetylglucosaminyldiphosphoundecaprenol N-acetyl-beta-D-mannosaminyltransferase
LNKRLNILELWVDPVDRVEAIRTVKSFMEKGGGPQAVFSSNPEKVFSIPKDPALHETYKNAGLLLPDGIGMVIAARILHGVRLTRIPGSEFIHDICRLAEEEGYRVFVYGAAEDVNRAAVERLERRYPSLQIAGRSDGYVKKENMGNLINRINESGAKILFIALGSPRQEEWFATYKDSLEHVRVCQGIGGSLDVIAGMVRRAPERWQRLNAEWLYRLISEPGRIRRQKVLPVFAARVLAAKVRSFCV